MARHAIFILFKPAHRRQTVTILTYPILKEPSHQVDHQKSYICRLHRMPRKSYGMRCLRWWAFAHQEQSRVGHRL